MTEPMVIWEYRQICQLEDDRAGNKDDQPQTYADDGYNQELRELGVTPDMMQQLRG
jgi:hypothetical protein